VPQFSGAVCPGGFFGGSGMQITLPYDPVDPGYALTSYICSTAVLSNTVPPFSATPQPAGSLVQSLSCTVEYSYFTATWSGTLTYNYSSVHQTRCSGGRGGGCHTGYFPVATGGSGEIATPPPPPPPPAPPAPVTTSYSLGAGPCDANSLCTLNPTDTSVIVSARLDINAWQLTLNNADGSVIPISLGTLSILANGDDGGAYIAYGSGTIYDANGNLTVSVDFAVNLTVDKLGNMAVSGGTLNVTRPGS
jgi:hypothetical protein